MLDYIPSELYTEIAKRSPEQDKKLRDFSQSFLNKLQEANLANGDFRRMELLIETLGSADIKNKGDLEKKIESLYLKYRDYSDFSYEYVEYLLKYKGDYKAGLNLTKEILKKDEKMRPRIEREIFMEIAIQAVTGNFQEYVLYGLKIFGKDIQGFIEKYRDASYNDTAIKNYNKALKYIKENAIKTN